MIIFLAGRRIVIKYGTNAVADKNSYNIDTRVSMEIAENCHTMINAGKQIILVVSGALHAGRGWYQNGFGLSLEGISEERYLEDYLAEIGQRILNRQFGRSFEYFHLSTLPILVEHGTTKGYSDLNMGFYWYDEVKQAVEDAFNKNEIAIFNSNDRLSIQREGADNDALAAKISVKAKADSLIIVSEDGPSSFGSLDSKIAAFNAASSYGIQTNLNYILNHRDFLKMTKEYFKSNTQASNI